MRRNKPIIGIAGGIGSGKSFVAQLFAEAGCLVINSDELVRQAYDQEDVKATLVGWWGVSILTDSGSINRKVVAQRIFNDPQAKAILEAYLHPLIGQMRDNLIQHNRFNPAIVAFVWDTPLLFETGLNHQCDVVVYVEAPWEIRLKRVQKTRNWNEQELRRRENLQLPLDKKRQLSDIVVENTADAEGSPDKLRGQIREVLSRTLATVCKT